MVMQKNLKNRRIVISTALLLAALLCGYAVDVANSSSLVNVNSPPGSTPAPTFGISLSTYNVSICPGTTETVNIQLSSIARYNGSITLSPNTPSGITSHITTATLPVKYNQSESTTITLSASTHVLPGKYEVTITGHDGNTSHSANMTLQVIRPDFSIWVSPSPSIAFGQVETCQIHLSPIDLFNGSISLSARVPSGFSAIFSPSSVMLSAKGTKNTTLTLGVCYSLPAGSYVIDVKGVRADGISHSASFTVQVIKPDFTISASSRNISVVAGKHVSVTLHLQSTNRFNGSVSLSSSHPIALSAPIFYGPRVMLNYDSIGASSVEISVPSGTPAGKYTVSISGSSSMTSHTMPITVNVLNP
jgi:uncharacterized membrane protein